MNSTLPPSGFIATRPLGREGRVVIRRENGPAIRRACAEFVELCHRIGVQKGDCVAVDGSKFKAVNNRDRNLTRAKIASRLAHLEKEAGRYIEEAERADRQETGEARTEKIADLTSRHHGVLPDFGPPGWRIFRAWAHGGWDAPEPFMSDIGTLLPMAL